MRCRSWANWDGAGVDTVGLYNPVTGRFFLRNANSAGKPDLLFRFFVGVEGVLPVAGDWNADGVDTVGLHDPLLQVPSWSKGYLRDANSAGLPNAVFLVLMEGTPLSGDWNDDGVDTLGTHFAGTWSLRDANSTGHEILSFFFPARIPGLAPAVGDWDGDGTDTPGVFDPPQWLLRNSNSEGPADVTFDFDPLGLAPESGATAGEHD